MVLYSFGDLITFLICAAKVGVFFNAPKEKRLFLIKMPSFCEKLPEFYIFSQFFGPASLLFSKKSLSSGSEMEFA